MDTFGEYVFPVRTYECGPEGTATLPALCNYMQEAASLNAEALGFSKSNFAAAGENISWVLTRMRVKMERYPRWEEKVTVVTFSRGVRHIVAYRDFELRSAAGERIGCASSEWMVIDLASRGIVKVPEGRGICTDFEISFRSETLAGEEVRAEGVEVEPGVFVHRVSAADGRDHVLAKTVWSLDVK